MADELAFAVLAGEALGFCFETLAVFFALAPTATNARQARTIGHF